MKSWLLQLTQLLRHSKAEKGGEVVRSTQERESDLMKSWLLQLTQLLRHSRAEEGAEVVRSTQAREFVTMHPSMNFARGFMFSVL